MTDIASLVIKADTSQVKTATNDLNKLSQAGGKAESASNGLASSFTSFRGALGALGLGITISQLVTLGDTYTTLKSKLGLVTDSLEQLTDVQTKLLDIANNQRKPLAEVTELYVKSANAASELGASQEDLLKFTEGVSAALTINGTTTAAAAGALLQLGQAIGGNIIQAQEYNSLIDGARPLLQAVADNMDKTGGSVNRLTMLVRDGKVTSKEFFDAAVKGSSDLISKSSEMEVTVGQALTVMGNTMLTYIGRMNDATEATNTLAQAILNAAKSDTLRITFEALAVLGVNVAYVFRQVGNEIGGIAAQLAALGRLDFQGFRNIREQMVADAKAARIEVDRLSDSILNPKASTGTTGTPKPKGKTPSFLGGGGGGSSSKALKENAAAMELATTYANLFESINQLNNADKTQTELLRDKLNAITNVDKATKDYINTQLDQIEADEARKALVAENVQKQIEFNAAAESIKDAIDPTREYNRELEKLKEFYAAGRLTAQEYAAAVGQAKERMSSFAKSTKDEFEELKDAINGFAKDATTALVDFAFGASSSFEQMANDFAKSIAKMIIQKQLMDPLFNAISGSMSSGGSGLLDSLIGGLFGGSSDIAPSASPIGIIGASYANGSEYIPRDMYAKLHAGERVLTKDENKALGSKQQQKPSMGNVIMNFTVSGNTDMRSQQQIAAAAFGGINRAYRRNA